MTNDEPIPKLTRWMLKHGITQHAIEELQEILSPELFSPGEAKTSEAVNQQRIRLAAPKYNCRLLRNNNGAETTEDGRHIRYGLANDSAKMNDKMKSADLIGITSVTVRPEHAGSVFGVFTSIEVKRSGWQYRATKREEAQLEWAKFVISMGGIAQFARSPDEIWRD